MARLEQFIKSGQLGPICLGMTLLEVGSLLGDPQDQSTKKNPLVLRYGNLHLTFWKKPGERRTHLREIAIYFQTDAIPLPESVKLTDWNSNEALTKAKFQSFLRRIGCQPLDEIAGESQQHLTLPSGVKVIFLEGTVYNLQASQRQLPEKEVIPLTTEREPSVEQIREMLNEANQTMKIGASRASLVIAWAGLEAVLRRRALLAGLQGRIGVQPLVLLRELHLSRNLKFDDFEFIDRVRQLRTATAHGLAPQHLDNQIISETVNIANRLLSETENGSKLETRLQV